MKQENEATGSSMEQDLFMNDGGDERVRQWVCRAYPATPGSMLGRVRRRVRQMRFRAMVRRASLVAVVLLLGLTIWNRIESPKNDSRHIARVEPSPAHVDFPLTNSDVVAIFSTPSAVATEFLERQQVALLQSLER